MLIPVLGRAGSGKTTFVLERLLQAAKKGRVLLLVPEQFSFEMEKQVYELLSRHGDQQLSLNVEVYSFTRLCHRVFTEWGGMAGEYVTDAARQLLMSLALDQTRDQLSVYSRPAKSTAFVGRMLRQVDEFKNAGVSPDRLQSVCEQLEGDSALAGKTREMALIYTYYQALLQNRFQDEKDSLLNCCRLLEGQGYFRGCTVFIDSFMTFMAGEKQLIRIILSECEELYITFPTDRLGEGQRQSPSDGELPVEDGTFDTARDTLRELCRDAKQMQVAVHTPILLGESHRFQNEQLRFVERWMPSLVQRRCPLPCQADPSGKELPPVLLARAANPYEEVRYAAAQIVHLVRQHKLRYREIAVIARDIEPYLTAIEDLFPKYGIPCFFDLREDVQSIPVFSLLFSALEALCSRYDTQPMLALGKNPLMGLGETSMAQLENYCFLWGVDHRLWLEGGFENNPRGLVEQFTDEDKSQLEEIRDTARRLTEPLQQLADQLGESCDGEQFARALYEFLLSTGAKQRLEESADLLELPPEEVDAEQLRTLRLNQGGWEVLVELLDVFCHVLEKIPLPLAKLRELFVNAAQSSDIGSIPNTLDQVSVGSADRMRPQSPRACLVLGLNQGEFPPQLSENGMFSETERDRLLQIGIQLNPSVIKLNNYEKYYLYAALTAPSEYLLVSCHQAKLNGETTPDSPAVQALLRIFPDCELSCQQLPEPFYIANDQTAFESFCRSLRDDTPMTATLMEYLSHTDYAGRMQQVLEMLSSGSFRIKDPEIARALFGSRMRLSPSRIERYFTCPFAYFCAGGLNLKPRRKVELSPMQSGTIIHFVLEKMLRTHRSEQLAAMDREQIRSQVQQLLREYLADRVTSSQALTKRFHYLFERLSITLTRLICQLAKEFSQSQFEPVAFELPIRQGGQIAPLELQTGDGTSVCVEGVVDRVDLMETDGRRYVRVVDYKSGSKVFRLDDVYYGLNLQMLIYLFTIWKNGTGRLEDALPAGVLYLPARDHIINTSRNASDQQVEQEHTKKYKMNGLVLEDPVCVYGMEQKAAGVFIPVKVKDSGGFDARSSLATLEQMGQMQRHIELLLGQMASSLHGGQIAAQPSVGLGYEPCQYCDFRSICQHQENDPSHKLAALGKEGFFEQLRKEGKEDGR